MSEKYIHTQKSLRRQCGFPEADFNNLWRRVRKDLNDPKNIVGLEGPKKHKEIWNTWVENYINDAGIVVQYWGEGTKRDWDLATDTEKIAAFLWLFVKQAAQTSRAAAISVKIKRESPGPSSKAGYLAEKEDLFASSATGSKSTETPITQSHSAKRKAAGSQPRRSLLRNSSSPKDSSYATEEESATPDPLPSQEKKLRRKSSLFVIEREGEDTQAPAKKARLSTGGIGTKFFGSSPDPLNLRPVISPNANTSPIKNPSPWARTKVETLSVVPQSLLGCVFETKIAGTNQFRIIYASETPTLALFIDKVYEKCALGPQQQIQGIDVWIGDDFITIDLEEEKDWGYITNCVVKNDARVKVVVEIA